MAQVTMGTAYKNARGDPLLHLPERQDYHLSSFRGLLQR
jgi:hypothetical protein